MPITVAGDDLNLINVAWAHLLTEHGLSGGDSTVYGWQRKSKWYGTDDEKTIKDEVYRAFDVFRQEARRHGEVTLAQDNAGRSVWEGDVGHQVGTGLGGNPTNRVRLVMEVKHSGNTVIVSAFPV